MKKQNKLIFLGILIILGGLIIREVANLFTLIIIAIGGYFVVNGVIQLKKK